MTGGSHADQDFIAHARQDIPMLLAEISRLQALTSQNESDITGEQSGHLAAAGNTIAPMYFLIIEKGYEVNRKDESGKPKKDKLALLLVIYFNWEVWSYYLNTRETSGGLKMRRFMNLSGDLRWAKFDNSIILIIFIA